MDENSRLIVKSLPNTITEKRLRELFSSHGIVTDCQLKYGQDGKFRKFAFVGFSSMDEAKHAKEYFDRTFIDTARIQVEFCRKMGDAPKNSKQQQQSTKPESKKSLIVEITDFSIGTKKKSLLQFVAPIKPQRVRISAADSSSSPWAIFFLSKQSEVQSLLKKDGKFFGGSKVKIRSVPMDDERARRTKDGDQETLETIQPTKRQEVQTRDESVEKISESGRLFVRNLPYVCTVDEMEELFKIYGPLADVKLPMAKTYGKDGEATRTSKGIALVTFVFPEHALKAFAELDGSIYKGRMLHILPGDEKPEDKQTDSKESASFKSKKAAQLKSTSTHSHNWNALFLNPNAVADVLTDRLDTEKSTLLDPSQPGGESLGVRMALGETHLVRETREFLLQNGVNLESFDDDGGKGEEKSKKRSRTVILVKNLPAKTDPHELKAKFEQFGDIGRIVLPPSGISALVEMMDEQEAKKAFKTLAYTRFKTAPLYLEWAPGGVFTGEIKSAVNGEKNHTTDNQKPTQDGPDEDSKPVASKSGPKPIETVVAESNTTIFVKNLNFETTDDSLRDHFARIGQLVYANVAKKRAAAPSSSSLSMGFGFVQYVKQSDAKEALKELQGRQLDDFALELKISDRQLDDPENAKRRKRKDSKDDGDDDGRSNHSETKLLVRNIPFQASQNEVEKLFKNFGDLRFVRLPKKAGADGHRGFGFVDFVSSSDAKKAMEAMGLSTHLFGRRLVLEWASTEDDTLEEMQKKAADREATRGTGRRKITKKQKVDLGGDEEGLEKLQQTR